DGELGPLFEPRDAVTLAAQLERLLSDPALVSDYAGRIEQAHPQLQWSRVADDYEALYERVAARRHDADGRAQVRRRLEKRGFIHVDLHMHTDHSPDCATPVDTLLDTA
ncbi:MAG: histidinol-phosphatase, partial [Thermoleophilaceae bacterium]